MAALVRQLGLALRRGNLNGGANSSLLNAFLTSSGLTTTNTTNAPQVFEVTAGVSVSFTWGGQISNATLTAAANTVIWDFRIYDDTSQTLWEAAATDTLTQVGSSSVISRTVVFTPTHSGTVRLYVRLRVNVTVGGALLHDVNTDGGSYGSPAEVVTASEITVLATPGLIRCGTTLAAFAQSGGNGSGVYATYSKTIVNTLTTGHAPTTAAAAQTYSVAWKNGATTFTTTTIPAGTTLTPSGGGVLVSNVLWPIAAFSPTLVLTPNNSALSTAVSGAGLPWVHYTTVPTTPGAVTRTDDAAGNAVAVTFTGAFTSDPRLPIVHQLQVDNSTYSTPPTSNPGISTFGQRLTTQIGFLAARVTDANGAGVNGLVADLQLWDANTLVYATGRVASAGAATVTKGGQDGWTDLTGTPEFYVWLDTLPGGSWQSKWVVTTANAVGLETGDTRMLTLLASDSRINVPVAAGCTTAPQRHWVPGLSLTVGAAAISNGVKTAFDAGTMKFSIIRFAAALGTTEYLTNPGLTWVTGDTPDQFTMTPSAGDAKLGLYSFSGAQTSTFNFEDLIILVQVSLNSTPYFGRLVMPVYGLANQHDGYALDPMGLFK